MLEDNEKLRKIWNYKYVYIFGQTHFVVVNVATNAIVLVAVVVAAVVVVAVVVVVAAAAAVVVDVDGAAVASGVIKR